jgi:hypothetical protein
MNTTSQHLQVSIAVAALAAIATRLSDWTYPPCDSNTLSVQIAEINALATFSRNCGDQVERQETGGRKRLRAMIEETVCVYADEGPPDLVRKGLSDLTRDLRVAAHPWSNEEEEAITVEWFARELKRLVEWDRRRP